MKYAILSIILTLFSFTSYAQTQLGADIDGEAAKDFSGAASLSADGSIVAIGAGGNDGNGPDAGHVRVYQYNGTSWVQLGADIDGEAAGDYSGPVSLSANGSIVAIGAPSNIGASGNSSGHVRLYQYNGTSWVQLGADIDGENGGDFSGSTVSLSADGSIVAIGAPNNSGSSEWSGHVRLFKYNGTSWVQLGADIDGEAIYDRSGSSVSLSANGSIVAIGSLHNDGNGSEAGHVRVYEYNGTSWVQLGADIDGEAAGDYSGPVSLSANGSIVAIGASDNDGNGSEAGHVRVYEYNGTSWVQLGADIDGEAAEDYSGRSLSLSADGSIVAIGASENEGIDSNRGHVRLYKYNGTSWVQLGADIDGEAADDNSGSVSLSADGSIVAIGAAGNSGNGKWSGHVRIYEVCDYVYQPISEPGDNKVAIGQDAMFTISTNYSTLQWSSDLGFGFQNLSNAGQYSGANIDTLIVSNVTLNNNNQKFRCVGSTAMCSSISEVATLTVYDNVGINDLSAPYAISVYPNPATSEINVTVDATQIGLSYSIYNQLGKEVMTGKLNGLSNTIDLGDLSKGVYLLSIGYDKNQMIKVLVQ
jgi:hypothetical protein